MNHLQHTHKTNSENNEEIEPTIADMDLDTLASIGDDLEEEEDESQLSVCKVSFFPEYETSIHYDQQQGVCVNPVRDVN